MKFVLIGHRGSGKSTLGAMAAQRLHLSAIDLDDEMTRKTKQTPAQLIAKDLIQFRKTEIEVLENLVKQESPSHQIIMAGGGIESVPYQAVAIWVSRKGWQSAAGMNRPRVRPELSLEEELQWMIDTRESRYQAFADAKLVIGENESVGMSSQRLSDLIEDLIYSQHRSILKKSFWIGNPSRFERLMARHMQVGSKAVEVRSDLFESAKYLNILNEYPNDVLFSVRNEGLDQLALHLSGQKTKIDVDIQFQKGWSRDSIFIASSHPIPFNKTEFSHMPQSHSVKWAPQVKNFSELRSFLSHSKWLREKYEYSTSIPQGKKWKWLRLLDTVEFNSFNYVSGSCDSFESGAPSWQELSLYAHARDGFAKFALIGDPVDQSIGAQFHNRFFRRSQINAAYVLIPIVPDELDEALSLLFELGFHGLSITAPHKRSILQSKLVEADDLVQELGVANTLLRTPSGFRAFNTDLDGMNATWTQVESKISSPPRVLVIGKGGVSPAVLKSLSDKNTASLNVVGWRECQKDPSLLSGYHVVVNTSGKDMDWPHVQVDVWVDLRYTDVMWPKGVKHKVNGITFFEEQAKAQLKLWGMSHGSK